LHRRGQTLGAVERLFSKPAAARRREQLARVAGQRHELHSAVAVGCDGKICSSKVAIAGLTMRQLGEAEIDVYLDEAGDAVTSVSAPTAEGLGSFVRADDGDHFHHPRLPRCSLRAFLAKRAAARDVKECSRHAHTTARMARVGGIQYAARPQLIASAFEY